MDRHQSRRICCREALTDGSSWRDTGSYSWFFDHGRTVSGWRTKTISVCVTTRSNSELTYAQRMRRPSSMPAIMAPNAMPILLPVDILHHDDKHINIFVSYGMNRGLTVPNPHRPISALQPFQLRPPHYPSKTNCSRSLVLMSQGLTPSRFGSSSGGRIR